MLKLGSGDTRATRSFTAWSKPMPADPESEARELLESFNADEIRFTPEYVEKLLAAALRRARAETWREAAIFAEAHRPALKNHDSSVTSRTLSFVAGEYRKRAAELEKT